MSTPVNHFGGKCPCIPFFIGGQMSEGGNVLHSSAEEEKINFPQKNVPDMRVDLGTAGIQTRHATDRATTPRSYSLLR